MYKCPVCIENNTSPGIRDYDRIQDVYLAIYLLAMSTTLVNPIVYYSINTKFRQYFHRCAQHLVIYVAHTLILKDTPSILRQRLVKCKMKKKKQKIHLLYSTLYVMSWTLEQTTSGINYSILFEHDLSSSICFLIFNRLKTN